jgi:4a-hydroxytetrahydrobiopterin dehydratase
LTHTEYLPLKAFVASEGVEDWRILSEGVTAFFATASLAESTAFVRAIAELADVEDHPPGIDMRRDGVTVRLLTVADDWYGPSRRDLELAQQISEAARELGFRADPSRLQSLLIIPGAPNTRDVMPFWHAVLGYERRADSPDEDLVDPRDRGPSFWFEPMDEPRPDGGGAIHIAVWVAPEEAEARLAAALAAGGRLVRDRSPAWWTLADAAGNEVDIATTEGRD